MSETVWSTGAPGEIVRRAGGVPGRTTFPTLDELATSFESTRAAHPDLVRRRRIGTSRLSEPIHVYTVGQGTKQNLVVGGVHPNEPIGSITAQHLISELCADRGLREAFDATWHIVPCIDPDGYRLNESWFGQPTDRLYYARRFYRPAPDEQVEWSFPVDYKRAYFDRMMPETQALARLMDAVKPDVYVPLHNAELGGVYYYVSRVSQPLFDLLHAVPQALGLPLALGEPESGDLVAAADAIYLMFDFAHTYDWLEDLGVDPVGPKPAGDSSTAYVARYGTLSLIAELPYWSHPASDDTTPTTESYAALLKRTSEQHLETGRVLTDALAAAGPYLSLDTPLRRGAEAFAPGIAESGRAGLARAGQPGSARPATVAEQFSCEDVVHMFRLRFGSMTLQALEAECRAGLAPLEVRRAAQDLAALYATWEHDAVRATPATPIALNKVAGVQYGAVLAAGALAAGLLDS
ncbi:MAG: hypothetical protein LBE08_12605 [Bifidobacteriaceae bacterium]|nr:hypothetical protein [Bifidobacteriaceae bacterium]